MEREGSWGKGRPVRRGVESGECIGEGKWKDNRSPTRGSSFFLGKVTALGVLCCFALFCRENNIYKFIEKNSQSTNILINFLAIWKMKDMTDSSSANIPTSR